MSVTGGLVVDQCPIKPAYSSLKGCLQDSLSSSFD